MLEPREISKLLTQTSAFYNLRPEKLRMKVWRSLLGYPSHAIFSFVIGASSLAWEAAHGSDSKGISISTNCAMCFLLIHMPLMICQRSLRNIPELSNAAVKVARALEKRSNKKHLSKMSKIARFTRLCFLICIANMTMMMVIYVLWPLYRMKFMVDLPFLPDNILVFFIIYVIQTAVFTSGPLSVCWIGFYHMEMSISMATMFKVIGDQFREAVGPDDVNALIEIHQRLLDASVTFIGLFSTPWFILFIAMTVSNILTTYIMIKAPSGLVTVLITLAFAGTMLMCCLWGEFLATSSKAVGFAVYDSDWICTLSDKRKDLSVVILRSDRPVFVIAGLFGKLQRRQFVSLGKTWYRFVQALMNLE